LLTPLTSPGDIYESEQSGHALALGPQSDVANINVAYFDDQVPTFVNQTQIGPRRSFVGRIDARNTDTYAPTNRPGRVFFWPADLYDPSYIPAFQGGGQPDQVTFITPIIDVIQYFSPQPSLVPARNDKTFRFTDVPFAIGGEGQREGWLIVPYWGRQSAAIRCSNFTSAEVDLKVRGVNYFVNDTNLAQEFYLAEFQVAPLPGGQFAPAQLLLNGNPTISDNTDPVLNRVRISAGVFDALAIFVSVAEPDGPAPVTVTVSDYVG
jgi:hypothetical protein